MTAPYGPSFHELKMHANPRPSSGDCDDRLGLHDETRRGVGSTSLANFSNPYMHRANDRKGSFSNADGSLGSKVIRVDTRSTTKRQKGSELTSRIWPLIPPEPPVEKPWKVPERCSCARVRFAAPKPGAPLHTARRSDDEAYATGGSGGIS